MKRTPQQQLAALSAAITDILHRHPRRIMGGIGALLLGTGVTAFGIAPLAPDAADLPVQQVVEALAVPAPQSAAIDTGSTIAVGAGIGLMLWQPASNAADTENSSGPTGARVRRFITTRSF